MNLNNKFYGLPHWYYVNYDEHVNRNQYMDINLSNLKVQEYSRVSASKYTDSNYDEWKDLLLDHDSYKLTKNIAGYSVTVLEFFKKWLNETDEKYLILSKDIVDFNLVEFWHFDWQYLMTRLPYDWDCIQLGFDNPQCIPFYLHQLMPAHTFGPSLLNRRYVKKIVRLHCIEDKYKLTNYIANMCFSGQSGTIDYFVGHNGKTYSMPLFPNNPEFLVKGTKKHTLSFLCRIAYYDWWKNDKSKFSLDEFFTYGKPNDLSMIKKTTNYIK